MLQDKIIRIDYLWLDRKQFSGLYHRVFTLIRIELARNLQPGYTLEYYLWLIYRSLTWRGLQCNMYGNQFVGDELSSKMRV